MMMLMPELLEDAGAELAFMWGQMLSWSQRLHDGTPATSATSRRMLRTRRHAAVPAAASASWKCVKCS